MNKLHILCLLVFLVLAGAIVYAQPWNTWIGWPFINGALAPNGSVITAHNQSGDIVSSIVTYPTETGMFIVPVEAGHNNAIYFKINNLVADQQPEQMNVYNGNNCSSFYPPGCGNNVHYRNLTVTDADNDGFAKGFSGYNGIDRDCNDNNASINPNATEQCNGIDDNCNNLTDEGLPGCVINNTIGNPLIVYVDEDYVNGSSGNHTFGYDAFNKIQDGIDAVAGGGIVNVANGTYNEHVLINKSLKLMGKGYSSTSIIDCSGSGTGILINSSNSIISGFKIVNCENGIDIQGKTNTITNNSFNSNVNGVKVSKALNNKINFNVIEGNTKFGIDNTDIDFVNAMLNYWGSCDGPGGTGNGKGDNVSIRVDFNPWIGVCITNKTNVTCKYETDNITLSANISSSLDISVWVSYTINNTNYNATVTNPDDDIYSYTLDSNELIGGMNVTWNYYANDTFGNLFNNSWKTFYVRNRTALIVAPPGPDGLNNWYITEPLFSLIKDSTGGEVHYRWDAAGAILYTIPFGLDNIPNPPKETAGTLELNWWTDFNACGDEAVQSQMFHIDLTNPVIKDLNPANNSIVYNKLRPNISAYLDEVYGTNSGINLGSVIMKIDGDNVSPNVNTADAIDAIVSYTPTTDLSLGKHNVTVNVTDNAGRDSELMWFFSIEEHPQFGMTVISPQDGVYGSRRIEFNISLSTNVKVLEYINHGDARARWGRLCSNCDEYGSSRKRTRTLNEGDNNITIRATDGFGNVKEENISLFIDSRAPRIIKTLLGRNKVTNGTGFYIKYTEANLQKVELFWNGSKTLTCASGVNQECTTDADLSAYDGNFIDYYFNVTDLARTVKSKVTRVKVDATPPVLNVIMPKSSVNGETYGRRVQFNITVSEDVLLEYYNKSDSRATRLCSNCDDYGNSKKKTKSFKKGSYDLLIRATDKAGQVDIEERSFVVS